jgi:hypothetical protein
VLLSERPVDPSAGPAGGDGRLTRSKPVRRQPVRMLRERPSVTLPRRIFPMHGEHMPCYLAAFPDKVLR